jgi:hypothetical protein
MMEKLKSKFTISKEGASSSDFIWHDKSKRSTYLIFELLGTAVMTYAFTLTFFNFLGRGMTYMFCFVLLYNVTGAHLNPATTLAVYLRDKWNGKYPAESDKSNAFKWTLFLMLA